MHFPSVSAIGKVLRLHSERVKQTMFNLSIGRTFDELTG